MNERTPFFEAHILAAGPWRCDQVKCFYPSQDRDRKTIDPAYINEFWRSYRVEYPLAFNGSMLKLLEIEHCSQEEFRLVVEPTTYAEYVATRSPEFDITYPESERANPIGMTIIVLSSDNKVVITRRSATVEQNPGLPYFVGGYVEPSMSGELDRIVCDNAARELEEELGVRNTDNMIIAGMAMDPYYSHPELFAITRLGLPSTEIPMTWNKAQGRHEASELLLLPVQKLLSESNESLFPEDVTWSFKVGSFFLRQKWHLITDMLYTTPGLSY